MADRFEINNPRIVRDTVAQNLIFHLLAKREASSVRVVQNL